MQFALVKHCGRRGVPAFPQRRIYLVELYPVTQDFDLEIKPADKKRVLALAPSPVARMICASWRTADLGGAECLGGRSRVAQIAFGKLRPGDDNLAFVRARAAEQM